MAWPKKKTQRTKGVRKGRKWKGRKGLAGVPKINPVNRPELKSVTLGIAGPTATIAANSGTAQNQNLSTGFLCCNHVQQGDSNSTRDGNVVTGVHLGLRFTVQAGANTELSDAQVRWMVLLDKTPQAINVVLGAILNDYDQTGAGTTTFNSALNPDFQNRFMILRQGVLTVSKVSGPTPLQEVSCSLPLYKLQTGYAGTANPMTYAYMSHNALYFVCFGRMTGAGTLPTISNFLSRYTFTEK